MKRRRIQVSALGTDRLGPCWDISFWCPALSLARRSKQDEQRDACLMADWKAEIAMARSAAPEARARKKL
jgi:hypothetical protein